jgi:uncharacterized protein
MSHRADSLDLASLRMEAGEGRRVDGLEVDVDDLELGGQRYRVAGPVPVRLDLSRMTGGGYALRLRFTAALEGPCMRCLAGAAPEIAVDAREVHDERGDEELRSPYVHGERVDLHAWARDALALALPNQVLCKPDCAGLCAICGENLNAAGAEHAHEREPDPRWAALRGLHLDG